MNTSSVIFVSWFSIVGCPCPDFQQFSTEAYPFFLLCYLQLWSDQSHCICWCSHGAKKTAILSSLVAVSSSIFCRFRLCAKQWPATQACHKLTSWSVVSFGHLALTQQDLQCNSDKERPWWSLCEVTEGTSPSHIKTCIITDEGWPWWSLSEVTLRVLCQVTSCCTRKSVRFLLKMNSV